MNVRVELDPAPIRHIAVQCPECGNWFHGWEIANGKPFDDLRYDYQINFATFTCPLCEKEFGGLQHAEKIHVQEVGSAEECYKGCLTKKVTWE